MTVRNSPIIIHFYKIFSYGEQSSHQILIFFQVAKLQSVTQAELALDLEKSTVSANRDQS